MSTRAASTAAELRRGAGERYFALHAHTLAMLCHRIAERFAAGGRLIAIGEGELERSDARHVAVEFVHPVIVGKRALPALAITSEGGDLARQAELMLEGQDVLLAFGDGQQTARALFAARARGCLTIAFSGALADWTLAPSTTDPLLAQELTETAYHLLWELTHVFFEHKGLLSGREVEAALDAGSASFLYPFLAGAEHDLDAVLADVEASVLAKSSEIGALRERTLLEGEDQILAAAAGVHARLRSGGRVLALGNGGSATDAMDVAADLRHPPAGWRPHPAIDLCEDAAILTAIANDVGVDAIFSRQVIAHGRAVDALLAFSTSGASENVIRALEQARRGGLLSVAFVGYGGGRIAAEGLADHVIAVACEHIPRIQEAQASAWHLMRELIERESREATR